MNWIDRLAGDSAPRILSAAADTGTFWLPERAADAAHAVDNVFNLILWICVFFFLLIIGLMALFIILYRARPGHEAQKTAHHNMALELTWSIIPIIIVVYLFYVGFDTFMSMSVPEGNSMDIYVTGQRWSWDFFYPSNNFSVGDLHVPLDQPVRLRLTSGDVIHSLYVPAFRMKMDAVPGRYTYAWFKATKPGEYMLYCAEYCGKEHSSMIANVIVHERADYDKWLEQASNWMDELPLVKAGELLVIGGQGRSGKGCKQCHTVEPNAPQGTGPNLWGIYGHEVKLRDGSTTMVEDNYLRESIVDPGAKIVAGFENVMPSYKGRLKDREISAIIEYIKSLRPQEASEGATP